jgi:PAS domain S-box-containing protein
MSALRELIDGLGARLLLIAGDGRILAAGQRLRLELGLGAQGASLGSLRDIIIAPDGNRLSESEILSLLEASQWGAPVECCLLDTSGKPCWMAATRSAGDPGLDGTFTIELMPIANQKAAIAAAQKELEHLSFALDATDQGVWDYNGATNTWYFSPAWKRMRGIPVDEEYSSNGYEWLDSLHPDDREMVRSLTDRQYSGELEQIAFEYRERHREGHWIWIRAQGRRMEGGADGKPLRIVGTDTDLTALRNSQAALDELERSELRWKIAVDSAEQGVWDYDLLTEERYYSDTWREMRGLGPNDRLARNTAEWLERVHPDDRERVAEHLAQCRAGRLDHLSLEYRERHEAGG